MKRSKFGNFMYNLTFKGAMFLNKHKWLYYILNLTWGILLTLFGFIVTIIMLLCFRKPHKYHGIYYFEIGKHWGGFETGLMFVRDTSSTEHVSKHELGHTYQNAILGPFMLILVSIPSVIRYWYRKAKKPTTNYDDIWFEGVSSDIGYAVVDRKEENNGY